jgi:hypothetical protein
VNALIKTGITVLRATAPFTVAGKQYPVNSYVVKTAQAFRPHVMDMFEPQDHPDDIPYPGGPPTPPYDATGYTLAFQMGVVFDRVLDPFGGPFVKIPDFAKVPAGAVKSPAYYYRGDSTAAAGYYFSHQANDSFIVVNRLLAANEDVSWLSDGPAGAGTFYVVAKPTTLPILQKAATELGISFESAPNAPPPGMKLRKLRIGLFDTYGSNNMPSGWTRKILEEFEFPFEQVFPPMLDAGSLRSKYDVLVFNGGGFPGGGGGGRGGGGGAAAAPDAGTPPDVAGAAAAGVAAGAGAGRGAGAAAGAGGRGGGAAGGAGGQGRGGGRAGFTPAPIPEEFAKRQGQVTAQTLQAIKQFVAEGGTVIAIGNQAMGAAQQFGLPVTSHLVESGPSASPGAGAPLPREKFYVPGAILQVAIDNTNPLAHGLGKTLDVFFENDPVFDLAPDAAAKGVRSVGWFASASPLRSGWAWGEKYLDKGVAVVDASVGSGRVFLLGPEVLFRSQPHGNYKLFFNGLYLSVVPGR